MNSNAYRIKNAGKRNLIRKMIYKKLNEFAADMMIA